MMKITFFVTFMIFSFTLIASELEINIAKCKYNDANACHMAASQYYLIYLDTKKALPLFKKACDLGDGSACYTTGYLSSSKADDKALIFYLNKGCKLKHEKSCENLEAFKNK